jgi:DNA gyrase/topoisomerase IV subunit B
MANVVTNSSSVLVRALIAYSVHEHQVGPATRVGVTLAPHSCTVEDVGRGMGLDRDGYVSGLLEQLTARKREVALHGLGLAILAMSSPLLTIESRRAGRLFTQTYSSGQADGPVRSEPTDEASGTRVAFRLSSEAPGIDEAEVLEQVQVWRAAHPNLRLEVRIVP